MKKIVFFIAAAVLLAACGDKPGTETLDKFEISTASPINLRVNQGVQILYSPEEAFSELEWTSSDAEVAMVDSRGYVTGVAEGSAKITGTLKGNGFFASIDVNVTSDQNYYGANTKYYTIAYYEYKAFPWAFKNEDGTPLTCKDVAADPSGLAVPDALIDSVYQYNYMTINEELYINGQGQISGLGGLGTAFWSSSYYSAQGGGNGQGLVFSLSNYKFVDLDTIYDDYEEKYGKRPDFVPVYYSPVSKFDESLYLDYLTKLLNDEQPSLSDFPYMDPEMDGKATEVFRFYPEEDQMYQWPWGTVEGGQIFINQTSNRELYAEAYAMNGKFFGGNHMFGVETEYRSVENGKVDNEEDEGWYYATDDEGNLVMAEMSPYQLSYTPESGVAPRSENKGLGYVTVASMHKKMRVDRAIYLPLFQIVDASRGKIVR